MEFKDKQIFYKHFFHEMSGEIMKCMFLLETNKTPKLFNYLNNMKKIFCGYRNIFENNININEILEIIKNKNVTINIQESIEKYSSTKFFILGFLYFYSSSITVINIYEKYISFSCNDKIYEKISKDFKNLNINNVKLKFENEIIFFDII
ncbi:hypothetical protein AB836_00880 [Rickettsiales bacterium (ex Bugula neritina AB1)]|nr:hypothetical protein AB836_00880 [Rickettsiales bacterium (ex Bugula neritina AB1)]